MAAVALLNSNNSFQDFLDFVACKLLKGVLQKKCTASFNLNGASSWMAQEMRTTSGDDGLANYIC